LPAAAQNLVRWRVATRTRYDSVDTPKSIKPPPPNKHAVTCVPCGAVLSHSGKILFKVESFAMQYV
jgi:hypothetical protein